MNTNNRKPFGLEAEASGTKPTLMQAGFEMIKAEKSAQEAANNLQNWVDTMLPNKHKSSNLGLCFAAAVAMILGIIIATLEIKGYLPQILPTALGGGPL